MESLVVEKECRLDSILHCPDGPALVGTKNGKPYQEYWAWGYRHRADGPAIIWGSNYEFWYYGVRHRLEIGKPTVILEDGSHFFHTCGQLHRTDGPAVVDKKRNILAWYQHGVLHRDGAPAFIKKLKNGRLIMVWMRQGFPVNTNGPIYIAENRIAAFGEVFQTFSKYTFVTKADGAKLTTCTERWLDWGRDIFQQEMSCDPFEKYRPLEVNQSLAAQNNPENMWRHKQWVDVALELKKNGNRCRDPIVMTEMGVSLYYV